MAVIECGISAEYFLDKMQFYEIEPFLKWMQYKNRESWNQTRVIAYITAQANSTKKITPNDILSFPWDDEEKTQTRISNEDVKRLKEKAEKYIKEKKWLI